MSVLSSPPKLGGVRGGLNSHKLRRIIRRFIRHIIRHIVPLFRPPLAPPDSGGETITVCLSMSKSTAKPRCRSLTVQRF